jgi:arylsulfatase A-like enzyme
MMPRPVWRNAPGVHDVDVLGYHLECEEQTNKLAKTNKKPQLQAAMAGGFFFSSARVFMLVAVGILFGLQAFSSFYSIQTHVSSHQQRTNYDPSKPMNVLLLYADDWSYLTLGAFGVNKYVKTPHLDQLAATGVLFTHNCVVTSICMQSRATLYTGQYSSKHQTYFAWRNVTMYQKWNDTLYPNMMKAGYHVGFYGKYHHLEPWPADVPTFSHHRFYQEEHYVKRDGVLHHITKLNELDGLEFLEMRPKDKPFFLTISFFATHAEDGSQAQYRPMNTSMEWYKDETIPHPKTYTEKHWNLLPHFFNNANMGRGRFLKRYMNDEDYQHYMKNTYRMVTEVDAACGKLIQKLKEQDVYDNTLIIFTTDNGNSHGQHGLAEKWYAYEESIRVPLIIRDPRMTSAGTKNHEFTLNIDLAPTILSAVGVTPPAVMQGRDMADLYLRSAKDWRKEFLYEFWWDNPDVRGDGSIFDS